MAANFAKLPGVAEEGLQTTDVKAYFRPVSKFVSVVHLRALCGEKGFAAEPTIGGKRFRLIDLDLGHAIRHPERRIPSWSLKEAVVYLRHLERGDLANIE